MSVLKRKAELFVFNYFVFLLFTFSQGVTIHKTYLLSGEMSYYRLLIVALNMLFMRYFSSYFSFISGVPMLSKYVNFTMYFVFVIGLFYDFTVFSGFFRVVVILLVYLHFLHFGIMTLYGFYELFSGIEKIDSDASK